MKGLNLQNITTHHPTVLVVDDEVFNLEILTEYLEDEGYVVDCACDGGQAQAILTANPHKYHIILLDRMMPDMDGIEVMQFIRADPILKYIPVIIQTAKATKADLQEGLDAGVLYYLSKPFSQSTLLAIVNTAVVSYLSNQDLRTAVNNNQGMPLSGHFECQTVDQARNLAKLLASACPEPQKVVVGLSELLINAVEHGNLDIGFQSKTKLQAQGRWEIEIERRLNLPDNRLKLVNVTLDITSREVKFHICDCGDGFNSSEYLGIDPRRAVNTHGRGIAIAKLMSFDELEFNSVGNEVCAVVRRQPEPCNGKVMDVNHD